MERLNPNSMLYWWPRIVKIDVPKPKTVMVNIDDFVDDVFECYYSEWSDERACKSTAENVRSIAAILDEAVKEHLGGYPVFMRSDYTSCKHFSIRRPLYRVESAEEFYRKIIPLIAECHEPVPAENPFGAPRPNAIAVREWLRIARWTDAVPGFYGNIEVRVIVEDGRVADVFPYYHISGLDEHVVRSEEQKRKVHGDYYGVYLPAVEEGLETIRKYAEKIASLPGIREYNWSMDFALVETGGGRREWYLIDMALAEHSWRPQREKRREEKLAVAAPAV